MSHQADQIYQSFLVRCWLVPPATTNESPTWRFELREASADAQKQRFSDLEQLKAFMSAKLAAIAASSKRAGDKENNQKGGEPWQENK